MINSWSVSDEDCSDCNKYTINWFEDKFSYELVQINNSFKQFRISEALMTIYKLIWDDFCSSYLEIIKPINKKIDLFTKNKSIYFFEQLMVSLHPFMPFISEKIWQELNVRTKSESIVFAKWPEFKDYDNKKLSEFNDLLKIISTIRKIKKEQSVSAQTKLDLYTKHEFTNPQKTLLKKLCALGSIYSNEQAITNMFPFLVKTEKFYLNIDFDPKEEINKVNLELQRYKKFLNSIENKLNNKKFVQNAPEEVILLEKKKKDDTILKIKYLQKQISSFS